MWALVNSRGVYPLGAPGLRKPGRVDGSPEFLGGLVDAWDINQLFFEKQSIGWRGPRSLLRDLGPLSDAQTREQAALRAYQEKHGGFVGVDHGTPSLLGALFEVLAEKGVEYDPRAFIMEPRSTPPALRLGSSTALHRQVAVGASEVAAGKEAFCTIPGLNRGTLFICRGKDCACKRQFGFSYDARGPRVGFARLGVDGKPACFYCPASVSRKQLWP